MLELKRPNNALLLTLTIMCGTILVGNILTLPWPYHDDNLCDVCEDPAEYHVISFISGTETHEFCFDHAFIWSFFNPWIPAEITQSLHLISLFILFALILGCSSLGFRIRRTILEHGKWTNVMVVISIFVIGVGVFFSGILTALAQSPLELKSEVLADEKALEVWGWKSRSEALAENESLTIPPIYELMNWELIDKDLKVWKSKTYNYAIKVVNLRNVVISGNATEISSPQKLFNFFMFDELNFDLWKANETYTAYYEARDKASVSFNFSIIQESDIGDLHFVVEESVLDVKPEVRVVATVSWIHKNSVSHYTRRHHYDGYNFTRGDLDYTFENIVVNGNATEMEGNEFNFYIMNRSNWLDFKDDETYTAFHETKSSSALEFSVPLAVRDFYDWGIYFIVENRHFDVYEAVNFSASISWIEKPNELCYCMYTSETRYGAKELVLKGTAKEEGNNTFNFYVIEDVIYSNWKENAYYEAENVTTTPFSISLTEEEARSIYFVAENPLVDVDEMVKISATLEYEMKTTVKRNIFAIVAFFGGLVMIIAGPSLPIGYNLKRKE